MKPFLGVLPGGRVVPRKGLGASTSELGWGHGARAGLLKVSGFGD